MIIIMMMMIQILSLKIIIFDLLADRNLSSKSGGVLSIPSLVAGTGRSDIPAIEHSNVVYITAKDKANTLLPNVCTKLSATEMTVTTSHKCNPKSCLIKSSSNQKMSK